jgi:hypothetical protein
VKGEIVGQNSGAQFDGEADWTRGPAKWGAVVVLGAASIWGMVWSMGRVPRADTVMLDGGGASEAGAAEDGDGASAEGTAKEGPGALEAGAKASPADAGELTTRININTATRAELELLPGIGPALAGRVLEYRAANGGVQGGG